MVRAHLDHIVIAAETLEQGVEYVGGILGVEPYGGGKHVAQGTHNKVLRLDDKRYLEVIAIDPEGRKPDFPRWFDLDSARLRSELKIKPRLITWVARTDDIDGLLGQCPLSLGSVRPMSRGQLNWKITCTKDGSMPGGGVIPPIIQWDTPIHPTANMNDSGCSLIRLEGFHTDTEYITKILQSLGLENDITINRVSTTNGIGMRAHIETPGGIKVL
ncbi:VOC family protein [bacterium]|nr:VOC family protein [bacterium]